VLPTSLRNFSPKGREELGKYIDCALSEISSLVAFFFFLVLLSCLSPLQTPEYTPHVSASDPLGTEMASLPAEALLLQVDVCDHFKKTTQEH